MKITITKIEINTEKKPDRRPTWKPGQEICRAIKRDRIWKEKQLMEPRR